MWTPWTRAIRKPVALVDCRFSVHPAQGQAADSELLTYYERLREYVQHEDDLINSRLTWSLTIHGFLFATLGIVAGKAVDVLIELHKGSLSHPDKLENVVVALLRLELIVAVTGFFVGIFSREAIVAAHNATQHLNVIVHSTGALRIPPAVTLSRTGLASGTQAVTPDSMSGISVGGQLLVQSVPPQSSRWARFCSAVKSMFKEPPATAEIVTASATNATNFTATFVRDHAAPVSITPLGSMLIPGITGGGDPGRYTRGARFYYLWLPFGMTAAWMTIAGALVYLLLHRTLIF